jgi:four helix bundle protein
MELQFERLVAYRMAATLADELHVVVASWPSFDKWTVGVQLIRSADSVGANIAEAVGRWNQRDQIRVLLIARGSLYETRHWVARAHRRELLDEGRFDDTLGEIGRTLQGLINRRRV